MREHVDWYAEIAHKNCFEVFVDIPGGSDKHYINRVFVIQAGGSLDEEHFLQVIDNERAAMFS